MHTAASAHSIKGPNHQFNEDRYRLLDQRAPLVCKSERGHLYAVIDGVGGAPLGMRATQHIADQLLLFYKDSAIPPNAEGLHQLLKQINDEIFDWGMIPDTTRPLGAAAATIMWFSPLHELYVFHAGDTWGFHHTGKAFHSITKPHQDGDTLLRYFGQGKALQLEINKIIPKEGDIFGMVSDGVTKLLNNKNLQEIIDRHVDSERTAEEIAQRAKRKSAQDDITALIVELEEW